jgi:hypothetical protein
VLGAPCLERDAPLGSGSDDRTRGHRPALARVRR